MIWPIFVALTFWFWVLVIVEVVLLFVATVNEKGWFAWISLGIFLALLQLFGDVYVWNNPWTIIIWAAVYLLGGEIYVFPKWYLYVTDCKRKYLDLREQFLFRNGIKDLSKVPEELTEKWKKELQDDWQTRNMEFPPLVRKHKSQIIDWMILWPFNLLWTLLNDPIRRFFRHMYYQIAEALQRISNRVYADVVNDIGENKK